MLTNKMLLKTIGQWMLEDNYRYGYHFLLLLAEEAVGQALGQMSLTGEGINL